MAAQEEKLRQNLEELQKTQDSMREQQSELNEMNTKLKNNEEILVKAVEKSKQQENELQQKVQELNKLHKELEIQQAEILDQNRILQEKEQLQAKALLDADKNLERARIKIMAEFVRNLEREVSVIEKTEEKLRAVNNIPPAIVEEIHDINTDFKILISKYKVE
jgi:predicted  nucleic acid-binding Zn-ribbon protein